MARDLAAELDQQAEQQADNAALPTWEPGIGETLTGTVAGYVTRTTKHGAARQVIVEREDGSGRIQVWVSSAVLRSAFEREQPKRGERIAIRYNGRHETKGYHLYGLVVDRYEQPEPGAATSRGPATDNFNDPFADE